MGDGRPYGLQVECHAFHASIWSWRNLTMVTSSTQIRRVLWLCMAGTIVAARPGRQSFDVNWFSTGCHSPCHQHCDDLDDLLDISNTLKYLKILRTETHGEAYKYGLSLLPVLLPQLATLSKAGSVSL